MLKELVEKIEINSYLDWLIICKINNKAKINLIKIMENMIRRLNFHLDNHKNLIDKKYKIILK
jgi:hypothetical protein